ncbi:MAG: SWIM zinc finger family protein [Nonomuraea sp.]|nr:SWIM zinc finger family protein [Nonomuraea sp.]
MVFAGGALRALGLRRSFLGRLTAQPPRLRRHGSCPLPGIRCACLLPERARPRRHGPGTIKSPLLRRGLARPGRHGPGAGCRESSSFGRSVLLGGSGCRVRSRGVGARVPGAAGPVSSGGGVHSELSVRVASLRQVIERWSRDQVLALAPDASSQKAAQGVAAPGKWSVRGTTGSVLFGECRGSGSKPYLACVDLSEPAYRCSCPSRKFPCKHALGLLLLWSADGVPASEAAPQWVTEWVDGRAERAARSAAKVEAARAKAAEAEPEGPAAGDGGRLASGAGGRTATESVRHGRVAAGLAELERWLADQVRQGLATSAEHDWDGLAKRLIDAQAPGVAGVVSRLVQVRAEDDWPGRLLEEYALINLLAVAYRRRADLPGPLAETVHIRAGFPVTREEVLARPGVRDHWHVLGRRDDEQDRLTARRVWLKGRDTGRAALILSFAPPGQPLDASLVTGTVIDADLTFYPGAAPLRALVATRHPAPPPTIAPPASSPSAGSAGDGVPVGVSVEEGLDEVARVLGEDPWTESWPLVLAGVVPGRTAIGGLPLHPRARDPWRLIAVSGGHPVTVAVEWTPQGVRPLTTWDDEGTAVLL